MNIDHRDMSILSQFCTKRNLISYHSFIRTTAHVFQIDGHVTNTTRQYHIKHNSYCHTNSFTTLLLILIHTSSAITPTAASKRLLQKLMNNFESYDNVFDLGITGCHSVEDIGCSRQKGFQN